MINRYINNNDFKIIATLSPATMELSELKKIIESGATHLRINCSHQTIENLEIFLRKFRDHLKVENKSIPLILDLQGKKLRTGNYPGTINLKKDKIYNFSLNDHISEESIPVPHEEFFKMLETGENISINDGKIHGKCVNSSENSADILILKEGMISSRRGINFENDERKINDILKKDQEFIKCADSFKDLEIDYALSFTLCSDDIENLKNYTKRDIIAKIERKEALEKLEEIALSSDELWLCRGDLGAQTGIYNIYSHEEEFLDSPSMKKVRFVMAGEVLHVFSHIDDLTRSEISYLTSIIKRGIGGIVLSNETIFSADPSKPVNSINDFIQHLKKN